MAARKRIAKKTTGASRKRAPGAARNTGTTKGAKGLKTPASRTVRAGTSGPGGFSKERLAKIPPALQAIVDRDMAVGVLTLIYRRGQIAHVATAGYQDREAKLPMKRDTVFRLASMTKPVTCAAALTLVEQGKMGLYDPIEKWIPEFARPKVLNRPDGPLDDTHPAPRSITVVDLMTHRSGLSYSFMAQGPLGAALQSLPEIGVNDTWTFDRWVKTAAEIPLAYDPGSRWNYGTSHDLLAVLIQRVSGQSYPDYLRAAILDPLGMNDTGFDLPKKKRGRLAAVYGFGADGKRVLLERAVPEKPASWVSGGGGLVSTVDDYLQFARMLLGQGRLGQTRILSRRSVALMTADWLTAEERRMPGMGNPDFWASQGFGLGVSVTDNLGRLGPMPYASKGTFSWGGATGVWWQADPVEDMIAFYMVQNMVIGGPAPSGPITAEMVRQGMALFYAPMAKLTQLAYDAIDD